MTNRVSRSRVGVHHGLGPVDRALMLIALGLDPQRTYTDHELQTAWRRRRALVQADNGGQGMMAAVNAAYVTLIGQAETPRPAEVRL
jgi:hypothetical protein